MNDTEILDTVLMALEGKIDRSFPVGTDTLSKKEIEQLIAMIKDERAEGELNKRISTEVARQLKKIANKEKKTTKQEPQEKSVEYANKKEVYKIVCNLAESGGSAPLGKIYDAASKFMLAPADVDTEIIDLVDEARIFEPVRYSDNYRPTQ